jgi:hypothetical protein
LRQGGIRLSAGMPAVSDFNNDFSASVALSPTGHLVTAWENFGTKYQGDLAGTGVFTQAFKNGKMMKAPGLIGPILIYPSPSSLNAAESGDVVFFAAAPLAGSPEPDTEIIAILIGLLHPAPPASATPPASPIDQLWLDMDALLDPLATLHFAA